jgi:hypothetical protein
MAKLQPKPEGMAGVWIDCCRAFAKAHRVTEQEALSVITWQFMRIAQRAEQLEATGEFDYDIKMEPGHKWTIDEIKQCASDELKGTEWDGALEGWLTFMHEEQTARGIPYYDPKLDVLVGAE